MTKWTRRFVVLTGLFALPAVAAVAVLDDRLSVEPFDAQTIVELTYTPLAPRPGPALTTRDPQIIARLATLLDDARRVPNHPCRSRATLTLRHADGSTFEVGLRLGHQPDTLEARFGQPLALPRQPTLDALHALGVDTAHLFEKY